MSEKVTLIEDGRIFSNDVEVAECFNELEDQVYNRRQGAIPKLFLMRSRPLCDISSGWLYTSNLTRLESNTKHSNPII